MGGDIPGIKEDLPCPPYRRHHQKTLSRDPLETKSLPDCKGAIFGLDTEHIAAHAHTTSILFSEMQCVDHNYLSVHLNNSISNLKPMFPAYGQYVCKENSYLYLS